MRPDLRLMLQAERIAALHKLPDGKLPGLPKGGYPAVPFHNDVGAKGHKAMASLAIPVITSSD